MESHAMKDLPTWFFWTAAIGFGLAIGLLIRSAFS